MKDQTPIPKRLKQARLARKISQKSLGIAIGIDEFSASARMNQYEQGVHTPVYQTVERIARFLGYPVSYFYENNDNIAKLLEGIKAANNQKINNLIKELKE